MDDVWLVLLQLLLVGTILGTLLTYLLRGLMCRATGKFLQKKALKFDFFQIFDSEFFDKLENFDFQMSMEIRERNLIMPPAMII